MVEKLKSERATCAIGKAPKPIDAQQFGRRPGVLHLVGIGPGEAISRTASAVAALEESTDWVGYGLYLDLVADLRRGQSEHRYGLGEEEPRVRHALELAAEGRVVALVCSGDAQIYAMAALAYELLDATGERAVSDVARRVNVAHSPRRLCLPGRLGCGRRADRPRFLLRLAERPAHPARGHPRSASTVPPAPISSPRSTTRARSAAPI